MQNSDDVFARSRKKLSDEEAEKLVREYLPLVAHQLKRSYVTAAAILKAHGLPMNGFGMRDLIIKMRVAKAFFRIFPCEVKDERIRVVRLDK